MLQLAHELPVAELVEQSSSSARMETPVAVFASLIVATSPHSSPHTRGNAGRSQLCVRSTELELRRSALAPCSEGAARLPASVGSNSAATLTSIDRPLTMIHSRMPSDCTYYHFLAVGIEISASLGCGTRPFCIKETWYHALLDGCGGLLEGARRRRSGASFALGLGWWRSRTLAR